jgi:hypothetical protein
VHSELDRIFEIQRIEHVAAQVIQGFWRRSKVLLPWRRAVLIEKLVIRIQRMARGMIARKWVAEWYNTRNKIIVCWQACTRRFISNIYTRALLVKEQKHAVKIQCMVRKRLAILRCRRILRDMAASRIQALWRGIVGRVRSDRAWLQTTVVPIQKIARRMIAVKKFKKACSGYHAAATIIQKKFRCWTASRTMGEMLWERELDARMDSVHMLTADEDYSDDKLKKLMHRLTKTGMKEKAENDLKRLLDFQITIYKKENDLIELRRQIDIVSPRAKAQGFLEELEKNEAATRKELTEMKAKCLFELSIEVYGNDELLEDRVIEIEDWALRKAKVAEWRDQVRPDLFHTFKISIL